MTSNSLEGITPAPEPARPRSIIDLLDYQRADVESDARFQWSCWARQTGKSFTKSLRRILRALSRRRTQIFLSAGERQSRELMEKARQHCQALKIAADFYDNRLFRGLSIRQLEITLPGGVRVIGLPANPQTARGYSGDVFLDEFAMHAGDRDIWAAMFPTLLRGDGELDVASTPQGKSNLFYQLRDNPEFSATTLTLPDAVTQGLNVDIEKMRAAMSDDVLFRQEFLCEFLDESSAFLTYDQIAACTDPTLTLVEDPFTLCDDPREFFLGVDIGRLRDLTVLWVFARNPSAVPQSEIENRQWTFPTVPSSLRASVPRLFQSTIEIRQSTIPDSNHSVSAAPDTPQSPASNSPKRHSATNSTASANGFSSPRSDAAASTPAASA